MLKHLRTCCLVLAVTLWASFGASAAPPTYLFKGDIQGTLSGQAACGPLTLTVAANTNAVLPRAYGNHIGTKRVAVYELAGIGPLDAPVNVSLSTWQVGSTTGGLFTISSLTENSSEARIGEGSVPEPGSLALAGMAAGGALPAASQRQRTARA